MATYNTRTSSFLRMARVLRVANAYQRRQQGAYNLAVAQLRAQYGAAVVAPTGTRAAPQQRHAPSTVPGACQAVRALCAQHGGNRKAVLAAAQAAGINPATAATQYATWRKANQ